MLLQIHKIYSTLYDSATGTRLATDVLRGLLHSKRGIAAEPGLNSFPSSTSNVTTALIFFFNSLPLVDYTQNLVSIFNSYPTNVENRVSS